MVEKRTILFVDDDKLILRSIQNSYLDESYNKLFALSGYEALEILQREDVHIIVTDMCMPGMDGIELLKIVREKYPHIVKIVLTGYTDMPAFQAEFNHGEIFKIVPKPWKIEEELKQIISEAVEQYDLQCECDTVKQHN